MIRSFSHKGLQEIFQYGSTRKINKTHHKKLIKILDHVNAATGPNDLDGTNKFHALVGNRKGEYALSVSGNLRVTLRFDGDNAVDRAGRGNLDRAVSGSPA